MTKTNKKAIFGSKIVNIAPVVKTIFVNKHGEEVIKMNGHEYKIADLKNNDKVFLIVCE